MNIIFKLTDRQELQNPLFDLIQPIMILLQIFFSLIEIQGISRGFGPGEIKNPVNIIAGDRIFRGGRRNTLQTGQLFFNCGLASSLKPAFPARSRSSWSSTFHQTLRPIPCEWPASAGGGKTPAAWYPYPS